MQRQPGSMIVAVLAIVSALWMLFSGFVALLIFWGSAAVAAAGPTLGTSKVGVIAATAGIILVFAGVLDGLFGIVAWEPLRWTRALGLIAQIIVIVGEVLLLVAGVRTPGHVLLGVVAVAILVYLLTPTGRTAFGAGAAVEAT